MSDEQYTYTGRVVSIGDVTYFGQKQTPKRELVVRGGKPEYPDDVPFEVMGNAATNLDKNGISAGDAVELQFRPGGFQSKKTGQHYPKLTCWYVRKGASGPEVAQGARQPATAPTAAPEPTENPPF